MSDIRKPLNMPIITGRPELQPKTGPKTAPATANGTSFGELLQKTLERKAPAQLTFSRHAQSRTEQRGIALSEADMDRLNMAVGKAGDKGLTDTLVFMNNTAFIVNVPSKVVITVVDSSDSENTVFTNIDGAVIV